MMNDIQAGDGARYMTELFSEKNKNGLTRDLIEALFPMFEQASAGAIAVDGQSRITWINSSYSHLLGLGLFGDVGQQSDIVMPTSLLGLNTVFWREIKYPRSIRASLARYRHTTS